VGTRGRRAGAALALLAATLVAALPAHADAAKQPGRVVALSPFTANTLVSLGVKPVGVGDTLAGLKRLSPSLAGVTRLPLSHPAGPNLEQLARLRPDLVLSTPAWRKGEAGMRQLDIDVRYSEPRRIAEVAAETRRIGRIVGKPRKARKVARKQQKRINASTEGITSRPTVLLVLGVGRTPYAFLPNSWGGDIIRAAGGRLLTEGLTAPGGYAKISDELVIVKDPDVIIAVPHGNPEDIGRLRDHYLDNPAWQTTRAVRDKRVHVALGNSLLQPYTDVENTIRDVRDHYLRNR
jgi:iron complex transport system substrate-binding protein